MSASDFPALDGDGRTPRERGEPVGATACGCPRATWCEFVGHWRCKGCGRQVRKAEMWRRSDALDTAHWCGVLRAAWRDGHPVPKRSVPLGSRVVDGPGL